MSEVSDAYGKPLPLLRGTAGEFYSFCARGELAFQRCSTCRAWRHERSSLADQGWG